MKYAIRLTHADGRVEFLASSRSGSLTDDIYSAAIFATAERPVQEIKLLREAEDEPAGATFDVVEMEMVVRKVIDVPRPARKSGYVIWFYRRQKSFDRDELQETWVDKKVWYCGPKGLSKNEWSCTSSFGTFSQSTAFPTQAAALKRIQQLQAAAYDYAAWTRKQNDYVPQKSKDHYTTERRRRIANDLMYNRRLIQSMNRLKVESVE